MRMPLLLASLALATGAAHAAELAAALTWSGQVTLAMPVSGVVTAVPAHAGQQLPKDALLAALEPTRFTAAVAEARAEVERMRHEQADALRDLERVKELYARTVSATSELDAAQLRHDRANAALAGALARLELARAQLREAELRAPFDAIILARMAEPGLVTANACHPTPLFRVARADELLARGPLPAEQASRLAPGAKIEVRVGGRNLMGEIRGISHDDDGRYRLEVAIPREGGLAPGQAASLRLP